MTDVRTEIEEETGLNLFEDKASAVGGFPHAMLGYDNRRWIPTSRILSSGCLR